MRVIGIVALSLLLLPGVAHAGIAEHTRYQLFAVHGKTARAIYNSVLSGSQRKEHFRTYATTDVQLTPKVKLVTQPQCKITEAVVGAHFIIHLPKLANEQSITPALRADWENFVGELKHHEERHREIWLGCAAHLASAATSVPASDCNTFKRELTLRVKESDRACRARNDALDAQAQNILPTIPFVQRALLKR